MTFLARSLALTACWSLACSQSTPPVDTPATLPPAEPPADVSREPIEAADAGKPEQQVDAKPVEKQ